MSKGKEFVDATIKNGKVVVFSKSFCPYCKQTKTLLNGKNLKEGSLVVVEMENRDDMDEMQDYLKQITGGRSVPRVFIAGKSVGGNDDTHNADKNGELDKMLKDAGAL